MKENYLESPLRKDTRALGEKTKVSLEEAVFLWNELPSMCADNTVTLVVDGVEIVEPSSKYLQRAFNYFYEKTGSLSSAYFEVMARMDVKGEVTETFWLGK